MDGKWLWWINKHQHIHTKKTNAQPTSNQELKSNPQQTNSKKWLVTPKQKEGGWVVESDCDKVLTSEITAKIGKNNEVENLQIYGFNNPRPDSKNPAETDQD